MEGKLLSTKVFGDLTHTHTHTHTVTHYTQSDTYTHTHTQSRTHNRILTHSLIQPLLW